MSIWRHWPWRLHVAAIVTWMLVLIDLGHADIELVALLVCVALVLDLIALAWACFKP